MAEDTKAKPVQKPTEAKTEEAVDAAANNSSFVGHKKIKSVEGNMIENN